ncbi:MAG TPA: DUF3300 domain-containing protein [Acidobacteriaceae bacterium]
MKKATEIFYFRAKAAEQAAFDAPSLNRITDLARRATASALMLFLVPLSMGDAFAQDAPPPPPDYGSQQGGNYQPLPPEDLNRMVAPIALYPDALVAQVLAASTYPAQVASAEQFVQQSGGVPPEQLGQMADQQPWDPSVKALVAFPQVLQNLSSNMSWTTQLGNAYYNQPQDVMAAVQTMRQNAYQAGNLRPTPQLNVVYQPGEIVIAPANPEVVYVPYYDPWVVYGGPIAPWGGYYYHRPSGLAFGVGLAIGFGVGIGIGAFGHFGWGYHNWQPNWHDRTVIYNHNTYISNSVTVVNHGNYGGFDRNPQARAFNHTQAVQYANVNHTTINNVQVNRTNVNNVNRTNINNNNIERTNINNNNVRNNNMTRPGAPAGQGNAGFNPRSQQNYNRPAQNPSQPGQFNNNARPAQPNGQFNNNGARPAQTSGQFNNGARPAQTSGQFNGAARDPQQQGRLNNGQRPAGAYQQPQRPAAQPSARPQPAARQAPPSKPAPQHNAPAHDHEDHKGH